MADTHRLTMLLERLPQREPTCQGALLGDRFQLQSLLQSCLSLCTWGLGAHPAPADGQELDCLEAPQLEGT